MNMIIDDLLAADPALWIAELPPYQSDSINELLKSGKTYEDITLLWVTATAQNTVGFSASKQVDKNSTFLVSVKAEIREYLCGNPKYKKEREGLFGEKGITRAYVVGAMAVSIAPYIGMAAPVLAPILALTLASIGKISVNAWCRLENNSEKNENVD